MQATSRHHQRHLANTVAIVAWLGVFAWAIVARSMAREVSSTGSIADWQPSQWLAMMLALAGGVWFVAGMPRAARQLGSDTLAMIGVLSAAYFAVSFTSAVISSVLWVLLGPMAVFLSGIGDALLVCLIKGMLITLRPRPGVLTVSLVTAMGLSAVCTGTLTLASLLFIAISIATHEGFAALLGLTTTSVLARPAPRAPWGAVARVAVAIALADGLKLWCQFALSPLLYRMPFPVWYVVAVALITGMGYGGVGAALGAVLGYRLRRTAP